MFKPEDFNCIGIDFGQRSAACKEANRLLAERGVRVWLYPSNAEVSKWSILDTRQEWQTHQALLVCIEELPKKECEHEPVSKSYYQIGDEITTWNHECRLCGVRLKAKWEVAE